jgi:hypothetical protein
MEFLIHFANGLYLTSYLMRDILWLRIFTIVAGSCLMFYFYTLPEPLLTPVYWNSVFVILNIAWVAHLLRQRRPVKLTADEQELCNLVFRTITSREMINLLRIGKWESAEAGECLVRAGNAQESLLLIHSGRACLEVDGKQLQVLEPGQFVGSISFITDEIAPASIVALEPIRLVRWPKISLKSYLTKNPELHAAIQTTLGRDLTRRLRDSWSPPLQPAPESSL